ncbi:MAG: hypothetical protein QM626_11780 [Microbacterium sp.]|uniref:MutS-related protein n=1 Tax=Microbacterium sp. TaxID=51671 RepID=UPI0039E36C44
MPAAQITTAPFTSILFPEGAPDESADDDALHDLALDQVFARLGPAAPRASEAYRVPLRSVAAVEYRQDVFRLLEQDGPRALVTAFLRDVERCDALEAAAARASYPYEAALHRLAAVARYVEAVTGLGAGLDEVHDIRARSRGWDGLARHVAALRASAAFGRLRDHAARLAAQVAALRYNALVRGGRVTVAATDDEPDLTAQVLSTFARFRQGDAEDYRTDYRPATLDHVQAQMLGLAAEVHPDVFADLTDFAAHSEGYRDGVLIRFGEEVRFYLAYLGFLAPLRGAGLRVCYPRVSADRKELAVTDGWDLSLAARLVDAGRPVVRNDLRLAGPERILVISGPNQGGKTTTARLFGQLHHLAAIGCPVPARDARVFLCDRVLTVFEREERLDSLEGRLGAEVQRLRQVFDTATGRSVIVVNEAFASTALQDARILTRDVLERISTLDALAACVTFIDELSRLNDRTVSMVSLVDPDDPAVRTFRVERRPADGRAHARALAARHGLTAEQIADLLPGIPRHGRQDA